MDLTKLQIEGYHYDAETEVVDGSAIYVQDDNEDNWLHIIPLINMEGNYVVLKIEDCQIVEAKLFFDFERKSF